MNVSWLGGSRWIGVLQGPFLRSGRIRLQLYVQVDVQVSSIRICARCPGMSGMRACVAMRDCNAMHRSPALQHYHGYHALQRTQDNGKRDLVLTARRRCHHLCITLWSTETHARPQTRLNGGFVPTSDTLRHTAIPSSPDPRTVDTLKTSYYSPPPSPLLMSESCVPDLLSHSKL